MGLTLLEAAKAERNGPRLAVIRELAEGELMRQIPFRDLDSAGLFYEQEGDLPSVGFRGLNEGLDHSYGVLNPQSEALKILGSDVDVDTATLDFQGDQARGNQVQMKTRSLRMTFEDHFINGDEAANPRSFDGLKRRIVPGSSQAIDANGALSLQALDELGDTVETNGGKKILVMNKKMRRRLTAASRSTSIGGFITTARDEFGKLIQFYNEIPIVVVDTNAANEQILPFSETDGGGSNETSIYCVSFGDTLTTALQGKIKGKPGISVRPFGEVPDAPVDRTRLEWYVGLAILHGRSAGRLLGITDAPVVA